MLSIYTSLIISNVVTGQKMLNTKTSRKISQSSKPPPKKRPSVCGQKIPRFRSRLSSHAASACFRWRKKIDTALVLVVMASPRRASNSGDSQIRHHHPATPVTLQQQFQISNIPPKMATAKDQTYLRCLEKVHAAHFSRNHQQNQSKLRTFN